MIKDVYPLTIVSDRYNGTYSGAQYTAWNLKPYEVPRSIFGDDTECSDFWTGANPDSYEYEGHYVIGKGSSVQEAKDDLINKLIEDHEQELREIVDITSKIDDLSYSGKKEILRYIQNLKEME